MRFAVLMRKQNLDNPWVSYRWVPFSYARQLTKWLINIEFLGRQRPPLALRHHHLLLLQQQLSNHSDRSS